MIRCFAKIDLIYLVLFTKLYSNPYQNFLSFLQNINDTKVEIVFNQFQYGEYFSTKGDLYIFSKDFYCYDDSEKQILINKDTVTSINKTIKQVIYDERVDDNFSIFDLLTGANLNIEIDSIRNEKGMDIINIRILGLNLKGELHVDSVVGKPREINLKNSSQNEFNIKIGDMIYFQRDSFPQIDLKYYEVIDFRE